MTLTVTSAADDRSLLTLDALRAATGVATGRADELRALGAAVAQTITRFCGIRAGGATPPTLRAETLTETFRLDDAPQRLVLARRPILSVTSVTEAGEALTLDTDYEIESAPGMLLRLCGDAPSCWRCGKIVVVYSAGWSTVPEDLALAASKLASLLWQEAGRDPNLKRVRIEGVSEREYWVPPSSDPLIPQEIAELLGAYCNASQG